MVFKILITLLQNMSVVAVFAYLLSRTELFKKIVYEQSSPQIKLFLVITFGGLSALGTYMGVYIFDAYANIRAIGAVVAGLLGGPLVGLGAGLIGGIHRYTLGGFTAFACAVGTSTSGLISGLVRKYRSFNKIDAKFAFYLGIVVEAIEMGYVLLLSDPFVTAQKLVKVITLPMLLNNALGIAIFINILKSTKEEDEKVRALQSQKALDIANKTLPHLREGLNYESATKTAETILNMTDIKAVSLTDRTEVLAHKGLAEDHHQPGEKILTQATKKAIETGKVSVARNRENIGCPVKGCELAAAVMVPMQFQNEIIGTLKFYKNVEDSINEVDIELATGVANLLSTQIKIARLEKEAQLATQAELKALQAQIHPHFLFNALNTIISFCRTKPLKARELLIKLSYLFRKTLKEGNRVISLEEELDYINSYISIEKARFGEKLQISREVSQELLDLQLPSFILQPLVENAVQHGISPKSGGGMIEIIAKDLGAEIEIKIKDNGIGIGSTELTEVLEEGKGHGTGIGLANVNARLEKIYGDGYGLKLDSQLGTGTEVIVVIPKQ
ncbi:two-component system, LytT family, sensor histidine kinase LytS [Selenihalanaerobacter shriftii]|uniref:histidine kinase n=2 Tax=Selenihalanaerobacter shriftii TaxID=142842 RepID=A0A1T4LIE4_9FIRM|nr:two-component system, LytT family, sensor histidine kinase LytS [Selenihalanaerobacter shriftii]